MHSKTVAKTLSGHLQYDFNNRRVLSVFGVQHFGKLKKLNDTEERRREKDRERDKGRKFGQSHKEKERGTKG